MYPAKKYNIYLNFIGICSNIVNAYMIRIVFSFIRTMREKNCKGTSYLSIDRLKSEKIDE